MADLIPWEVIEPGMTVWEECVWGGGPIRANVIQREGSGRLAMRYTLANGVTFTQITQKSPEFRYWNAEPAPDEREGTSWP